jgi:tryptophanase
METTKNPSSAHHIVITLDFPALSEYIAYLKDEQSKHQQKKIDEMTKQVIQLTDQLKASGVALSTSESQLHIG